ncbi:MAG: PilN domain-containing protein [Gemmatimonadota bacterium]|nr:PilN domain-containing protein [Gemmatimonadota bacterium]
MRIEINLLGGQKKKRKAGAGLQMPDFRDLFSGIKDPLLLGAAGAAIAVVAFVGLTFSYQQARLSSLNEEVEVVRAESRRYSNLIAQKRHAERLQDSLRAELQEIRSIDADRYVWPHILEEVTKALPDYSWLVGLGVLQVAPLDEDTTIALPVQVQLEGRTAEIAAYTRFLRRLAASPWFRNVTEGPATTVVEDDKAMQAFSVTATFRTADSAFIRTVPVMESVR